MQKKILYVLALLCLYSSQMLAQMTPIDIESKLKEVFAPLDVSPIRSSTNIFMDRLPQYLPLSNHRGKYIHDSIRLTSASYLFGYGMVQQAYLSNCPIIHIDSFQKKMDYYKKSNFCPISITAFKYDRIKSNAFTSNMLIVTNNQVDEGPNYQNNPFTLDTVIMASTFRQNFDSLVVPYYLDPSLLFTNLGAISNIQIDFKQGQGYETITLGQVKNISYPSYGTYKMDIKITLSNGILLLAGSKLDVVKKASNSFRSNEILGSRMMGMFSSSPNGKHHLGTKKLTEISVLSIDEFGNYFTEMKTIEEPATGVEIHYWYNKNCMDDKLRKPLIIIEGFDPSNKYSQDSMINGTQNGLLDNRYDLDKPIKDLIHDENYDLFYINYIDGTADIRANAAFVKQAIEWINTQKHLNGSSEKNIVIGASMGGLVGKWALREFELFGQDHEAELFMSFDSPMRGANVPLALQCNAIITTGIKVFGKTLKERDDTGKAEAAFNAVNAPAAKQMLYYHIGLCPDGGCSGSQLDDWHDAFYNELDSRGELVVPYVALSNGAINGIGLGFGAGAMIQDGFLEFPWQANVINLNVNQQSFAALNLSSTNQQIYRSLWSYVLPVISIGINGINLYNVNMVTAYDNAPGGLRAVESPEGGIDLTSAAWLVRSFCFIPTISSLDLRGVTNPFTVGLTNITGTTSGSAPQVRSYNGSTMPSLQFEEIQVNQEHVSLNNTLATFLLGNIKKYELNDNLTNRTYNYGATTFLNSYPNGTILSTSHVIKKNLTISNTGKLWINRDAKIDYTDLATNPPNNNPKFFDVSLGTDFCANSPTTVTVINGGEIFIGQDQVNNTGSLIIPDKTKLVIESGGIVTIDNLSNITVKSGGTIEVKSGGRLIILGDGRLNIENRSSFIVHDGAEINLDKPMSSNTLVSEPVGSLINLEGKLILPNGILLLQGKGFLRFGKDHELNSQQNFITFASTDDDHIAYRVDEEVVINQYNLNFLNAGVFFNKDIKFFAKTFLINGCNLKADVGQLTVNGDLIIPYGGGNFVAKNIKTSTISNSTIFDVSIIVDGISGSGKPAFFINNVTSQTKKRANNLQISNVPVLSIERSAFNTVAPNFIPFTLQINPLVKTGANLENVGSCKVVNSTFDDFTADNGILPKGGQSSNFAAINCKNSPNVFLLDETVIDNCGYGVYSEEALDVLMERSTISNSWRGIYMNGTASSGLVKMVCSSLIENNSGIYGLDITLAIDAIINQQNLEKTPQNTFTASGLNHHFIINYSKKNETTILGRQNLWNNPLKYVINNQGGVNIIIDQSLPGNGDCDGKKFALCNASPPIFPITQPGIPTSVYNGFCINQKTCKGFPIMEYYWKGYNCLVNGEYETAIEYFTPLAEESYNPMTYEPYEYCQYMLLEARAWVGGSNNSYGGYIQLDFDSTTCSLSWSPLTTGVVFNLQKKINNVWTNVTNVTNPYSINSSNEGNYRIYIEKDNCPVFYSNEVTADCQNICIDLVSATFYDTLLTCITNLPQPLNFNIKIDLRYYNENEPAQHTMVYPIVGSTGLNTNIIDAFYQYPTNLGYLAHWTVYVDCPTCNLGCDSSIVLMLPPARLNVNSNEVQDNNVNIYPNPFNNFVNITLPNGNYLIELNDISGKKIKQILLNGTKTTIDNSDLNAGVYIINIRNQENDLIIHKSKLIKIE
jgi:hypothetical protein